MENEVMKDTAEDRTLKVYEIGYHILPQIGETELPAEVGALKGLIESNGGLFISDEFPKLRQLAYDIPKVVDGRKVDFDQAYFGWVKFEIDPEALPAIKKALDTNLNVLRHILVETVRENTMSYARPAVRKEGEESAAEERPAEKREEITAEDEEKIAKSIDELISE